MTLVRDEFRIGDAVFAVHSVNTLVVGSGAAGLNAALQLRRRGQCDVAIVTECWGAGASFEAGSDKQTYYKLALAHDLDDSPYRMAEVLFSGGCVHGDIALCEAQHSAEAFHHLVYLGVPFPHDVYGAYVGYRTDNDPASRATSAGPLTSRAMCECLGAAVRDHEVPVFDRHQVIALLVHDDDGERSVCGAVAIDRDAVDRDRCGLVLFNAVNVILATGGPGGMYANSVYPVRQVGATGVALAVGAAAQNLTESQFGIASIGFRWNLSGSYQQSIPRYVSTDAQGNVEREFLNEHFPSMTALTTAVFRKGYEWPFDADRVLGGGSSLIDVLVHREIFERGRRVFLDYTRDADGGRLSAFTPAMLDEEARRHLARSDALLTTPIRRLRAMNEPAYELFREHGIDLERDRLEVAVCAQHCNGGLIGNLWWESNMRHLFPVGEINGSHGVRRPGGSALNAGQVGGIRAAMFIAKRYAQSPPGLERFGEMAAAQIRAQWERVQRMLAPGETGDRLSPDAVVGEIRRRMSASAAILREPSKIDEAAEGARRLLERAERHLHVATAGGLPGAFQALDLCLTHWVYLEAIRAYIEHGGASRGSFLVLDPGGVPVHEALSDSWRFMPPRPASKQGGSILRVRLADEGTIETRLVPPRPIPREHPWFETVWDDHRHDRVVR
ncbi:MAG: FAD-binding protein [Planctomycetota bacterium]|nr:FAD-binding protein [Planctomycetota bacterium]